MKYIKNSWNWFKEIMHPYRYVVYVADLLLVTGLMIILLKEVLGR